VSLLSSRNEQKRFLKFSAVGAIGAVVDFITFNLFSAVIGVNASLAQALSFGVAVTSNFVLNRYWTFPDSRSKKLGAQAAQYLLINIIGLIIRTPVFVFAGRLLTPAVVALAGSRPLPFGLDPEQLAHNLALATAIGVVLLWNYFVSRRWTFGDVE